MMTLGFHTDAFNSANWPFEKPLAWTRQTLAELGIKEERLSAIKVRSPKSSRTRSGNIHARRHVALSV